jgi:hypothetical protein
VQVGGEGGDVEVFVGHDGLPLWWRSESFLFTHAKALRRKGETQRRARGKGKKKNLEH